MITNKCKTNISQNVTYGVLNGQFCPDRTHFSFRWDKYTMVRKFTKVVRGDIQMRQKSSKL